jgi:hypothetical protein
MKARATSRDTCRPDRLSIYGLVWGQTKRAVNLSPIGYWTKTSHTRRELWLGTRPALVAARRLHPAGQKAAAYIDDCAQAAHDSIGNFLIPALLALAAVTQKQNTRSGVDAGRSVAGANQLLKVCPLFHRKFDVSMLAHAVQHSGSNTVSEV